MQSQEKSLINLDCKPLIEHVSYQLSTQGCKVIVNANGNKERFSWLNLPVIEDTIDGFAGPLAGILSGMKWAIENTSSEYILTAATDTPFFPDTYVEEMAFKLTSGEIKIATSLGKKHPVFGLWPVSLANDLEAFLRAGDRKIMLFVQQNLHSFVDFPAPSHDPFFNINTPEDLALAQSILESSQ